MPSYQNQGEKSSVVFSGRGRSSASRQIYGESAELFASLIARRFPLPARACVLADVGSFKGELLRDVLGRLPDHLFETVAIDINSEAIADNTADRKIIADAVDTRLADKTVDIAMCRYVLQWNPEDKQREILRELARITRRAIILQHFGADEQEPRHRARLDELLSGRPSSKLLREDYYLSSAKDIEAWLTQQGLEFVREAQVRVDDLSDSFIDRYELEGTDAQRVRDALEGFDYIVLTTWTIHIATTAVAH